MRLLSRRSVNENKLRRNVNIRFLRYSVSIEPHSRLQTCQSDPPPLKWSAAMYRKRRIHDGKQATQARRMSDVSTNGTV